MIEVLAVLVYFIGGVPHVNMTIQSNYDVVPVKLPVRPILDTILVVGRDGSVIPSIYYPGNNTLMIFALDQAYVVLSYVGNYTVSGGIYTVNVDSSTGLVMLFPPNVIPLDVPNLMGFSIVNGELNITAPPGNYTIQYVVIPSTTINRGAPNQGTPSRGEPQWGGLIYALPYIVIAIIIASLSYFLIIRRGVKVELNDDERLVVRILEAHGGSLYLSELHRLSNIPRTTLWRIVRRLEALGYVRIIKEGGVNRIILRRTYSSP